MTERNLREEIKGWESWHNRLAIRLGCNDDRVDTENAVNRLIGIADNGLGPNDLETDGYGDRSSVA